MVVRILHVFVGHKNGSVVYYMYMGCFVPVASNPRGPPLQQHTHTHTFVSFVVDSCLSGMWFYPRTGGIPPCRRPVVPDPPYGVLRFLWFARRPL